jgi:hypothetical protein
MDRPRMRAMPVVEFLLQRIAFLQQGPVAGRQVLDHGLHTGPEGLRIDVDARKGLVGQEPVQFSGHLQPSTGHIISHVGSSS